MFAIAFDLDTNEAKNHFNHLSEAYQEIKSTLNKFGFDNVQGSVYTCDTDDMANLFQAIMALKALSWFPLSVRDLRAFRIEQWSDFTPVVKQEDYS